MFNSPSNISPLAAASPLPVTVEKRRKMAEFIQRFPQ